MKFTILINQRAAEDAGFPPEIDIIDLAIVDYIVAWKASENSVKVAGGFVWIALAHTSQELPRLGLSSKQAISQRIDKLVKFGLFEKWYDDDKRLFLKPTKMVENYIWCQSNGRGVNVDLRGVNVDGHSTYHQEQLPTIVGNNTPPQVDITKALGIKRVTLPKELTLFRSITGRFPSNIWREDVVKAIQSLGNNAEQELKRRYKEWLGRGYNPMSVHWIPGLENPQKFAGLDKNKEYTSKELLDAGEDLKLWTVSRVETNGSGQEVVYLKRRI